MADVKGERDAEHRIHDDRRRTSRGLAGQRCRVHIFSLFSSALVEAWRGVQRVHFYPREGSQNHDLIE